MDWQIADPGHLVGALRVALAQGGHFLVGRLAPNGPILREPNLSYVHKAAWGMHDAGVDHDTVARLLDWAYTQALQPNGDFYLPGEPPEYKDLQRAYRPLTFGKVAAWIKHPLARDARVVDRLLQYQHRPSGGVFHYIGDDPAQVEPQPTIGSLNTTFFGHFMVALDMREQAVAAADWVRAWVEANRPHLADGLLYTQMTPAGDLVTRITPGQRILQLVDRSQPRQEFWHVGTAMAYLAVVYEAMRTRWSYTAAQAQPYLEAALALLDFECTMPLDTYLWPSKCKVGWGAGELLRVLIQYAVGPPQAVDKAWRVAERVAIFTFLDNQFADGGWAAMHYPLADDIPELAYTYKPFKDTLRVPTTRIAGSRTIYLPAEEITGEFLGEMKSIERGLTALLQRR